MPEQFDALVAELVRKHGIATERLTEQQLAEAIKQAILAGDFERHIDALNQQQIVYIPYAREQALTLERNALRYRVEELEESMRLIARETGYLEKLENAETRADAAAAAAQTRSGYTRIN